MYAGEEIEWSHPAGIGRRRPALFPVRDWLRELDNRHGDRVQKNIERERMKARETGSSMCCVGSYSLAQRRWMTWQKNPTMHELKQQTPILQPGTALTLSHLQCVSGCGETSHIVNNTVTLFLCIPKLWIKPNSHSVDTALR